MSVIDQSQPLQRAAAERLRTETIIWLGSVRPDGRPHLVPVWFWWDGETILILSQPENQKIRNIRHQPTVTLALETGPQPPEAVILHGWGALLTEPAAAMVPPGYTEKYAAGLRDLKMTAEEMLREYAQPIRITPMRLQVW